MESDLLQKLKVSLAAKKPVPVEGFAVVKMRALQQLALVRAALSKVNDSSLARTETLDAVQEQVSALRSTLRTYNKNARAKAISGMARDCDLIFNKIQSALDMIETRDLDTHDLSHIKSQCVGYVLGMQSNLTEYKEKPKATSSRGQERVLSDSVGDPEDYQMERWRAHIPTMTSVKHKKSFLFTIPVVGIMNMPVEEARFKSAGFQVQMLNGHPMFLNQSVLGLNASALADIDTNIKDYKEKAISAISRKTGRTYQFVVDKGITHKMLKGIMLFWIMPASQLDNLHKAGKGRSIVREWGLPI